MRRGRGGQRQGHLVRTGALLAAVQVLVWRAAEKWLRRYSTDGDGECRDMLRAALRARRIAWVAYVEGERQLRAQVRAVLVCALHAEPVVAGQAVLSSAYIQDLAVPAPRAAPVRVWHDAEYAAGHVGLAGELALENVSHTHWLSRCYALSSESRAYRGACTGSIAATGNSDAGGSVPGSLSACARGDAVRGRVAAAAATGDALRFEAARCAIHVLRRCRSGARSASRSSRIVMVSLGRF